MALSILTTPYADGPVLIYFLVAAAFCTWRYGAASGLIALSVGFVAAWIFLLPPSHSVFVTNPGQLVRLCIQSASATLIIYFLARVRQSRTRERLVNAIVESSDDAIIGKTLDGVITSWNPGAQRLYGYTPKEIVGQPMSLIMPPENAGELDLLLQRLARGERIEQYDTVRLRKDGSRVEIAVNISPILDSYGHVIGASSTAHDITARKLAEAKLRQNEQALAEKARLLDLSFDAILVRNAEDRIVYWNEGSTEIYGYTAQEAIGSSPHELLQTRFPEPLSSILDALYRDGRWAGELTHVRKDGGTVVVASRWSLDRDDAGNVRSILETNNDVTQRKRAETLVSESERRLRTVIENLAEGLIIIDEDGNSIHWNRAALRMHGYETPGDAPEDMRVIRSIYELRTLEDRLLPFEQWPIPRLMRGETLRGCELVLRDTTSGLEKICSYNGIRLPRTESSPGIGLLSIRDITEQKRAEQALRRSEQRLRRFYESGMVGVIHWDIHGAIIDANDKFLQMVGYTRADLAAGLIDWARMTPTEYRDRDEFALHELETSGVDTPYEKEYIRKDGSRVPVVVGAAMLDQKRIEGMAFVLDITERKRTEHALINSEKLASVGRMAAAIAHEINNPLAMITNSVYIASLDETLSARARQSLQHAEQELERVAHLTRQTLGFYRENTAPANVDLNSLVAGVIELYRPKLLQGELSVDARYGDHISAHVIAGEIRQVVSNLITNAIEASAPGNRIRVRTARLPLDRPNNVRLTVADTGAGIAPENLNRIFEPFFTTKKAIGTGLGLWVSSEIVLRHGGKIRVRSTAGKGTVFSVFLPGVSASE